MPKANPLLATVLVILLIVSFSGCIEQQDPPEEGKFTIEVESDVVFFLTEDGGTLHGAHAHVETELHHEHPEYNWTIGDQHYEGSEVEIEESNLGIEMASYELDYYGEERHIPVYVVTFDAPDETWAFVASGSPLEHNENGTDLPRVISHAVSGLNPIGWFWELSDFHYRLMMGANINEDGVVINVTLPEGANETTSYVFGLQWTEGSAPEHIQGSARIKPGELHQLHYSENGGLELTIANESDPEDIYFEGAYEDLPTKYGTHLGALEWEGEVGPEEEAPGMTAWSGLLALAVVVLVASRRRR